MNSKNTAVLLVGHGGWPSDCPEEMAGKLKRLESKRRKENLPPSEEEIELDTLVRAWPRTPETDPYKYGLELLGSQLAQHLNAYSIGLAYNEFCDPTIDKAASRLIQEGAHSIIIVSTMFTPGGSHSEKEIPEEMELLQKQYPQVEFIYAWPFDMDRVSGMLAEHVTDFANTLSVR
jgi:sirohydrochlorin cobaltochelatase